MVDGKEADHFELSIDIKQAIADGVIEAGNDLCVNYTAVLNDKVRTPTPLILSTATTPTARASAKRLRALSTHGRLP